MVGVWCLETKVNCGVLTICKFRFSPFSEDALAYCCLFPSGLIVPFIVATNGVEYYVSFYAVPSAIKYRFLVRWKEIKEGRRMFDFHNCLHARGNAWLFSALIAHGQHFIAAGLFVLSVLADGHSHM